jgi:hypothetical protein
MYDVRIRYGDGRRSIVESHIDDLGEACSFVLKLADELGGAGDDDDDTAKWVEVYRYDRLEISVSVVRGGLGDRRLSPTLRSSG